MQNTSSDVNPRFKLAQIGQISSRLFHSSLEKSYSRNCIMNEILKDDFNINQKFNIYLDPRRQSNIHLKDCTALHFLSHVVRDIDTFTTFIARGADFTVKNGNGQTALHLVMTRTCLSFTKQQRTLFIDSVLSAHVKSQNFTNPRDNDGISHLHGACMNNHVEAAKLFLDNGVSIEEAVSLEAFQFAGWTPLHFAVAFGGFKVAQILVERGANVNAKTAKGRCPLDMLFNYKYSIVVPSQDSISEKEELLKLLLGKNAVSAVGLSALHVACSLKDLTMAERLLEEGADISYAVPSESPIRPGRTALHIATENGIEAVKMLLKRGAKIDNRSLRRPYQSKYSLQELCEILSCIEIVKELRLSDGQTKVLDLVSAMESLDNFRRFFLQNETMDITAVVPHDSVMLPGYSILHLAVTFTKIIVRNGVNPQRRFDTTIVEECLNRGLSLDVPNLEEQTPIHLAYCQNKLNIVRLMFEHQNRLGAVTNLLDHNNLSYLHIACAVRDEALTDRLLSASNPTDLRRSTTKPLVYMEAGSTPLHAAASSGSRAVAELLLERGADLHATDASGLTPIHRLYERLASNQNREIVGCLMGSLLTNVVDRVVDGLGLSYLHIASAFHHTEVIEKLLDLGSNINAVVGSQEYKPRDVDLNWKYMKCWENMTPLELAILNRHPNDEVLDLLLRRGADVFVNGSNKLAERFDSRCAPIENARVLRRFFRALWEREDMQKSMEQRFGLTKLHVACYLKDEEAIRSALIDAVDINVPVNGDSIIFAGCTPLHLLVTVSIEENLMAFQHVQQMTIGNMLKMLIDRDADVTISNVEKATPIHVLDKLQRHFIDLDLCKDLLLNAHRDFSVNPVNDEGWSHFHLACYWHRVKVVEKFLQHGSIDVNQPLDYFIGHRAGCTPLHLALNHPMRGPNADWTRLSKMVDLLLKHGANVAAKDVRGRTALHTRGALYSPGMSIFEKLVSCGGDVKCEDLQGQSPIERLASIHMVNDNLSDNLTIFIRYGYRINGWNRLTGEGYIGKIFLLRNREKLSESFEFKKFVESSAASTVDDLGRTAIHNAVGHSVIMENFILDNYEYAIESLVKVGIDIDYRDKSGRTALHYAAQMENFPGVQVLLACGADVNAVDNSGKSPFSYATEYIRHRSALGISVNPNVTAVLCLHVKKLQHLKLEVSHLNKSFAKHAKPPPDVSIFRINDNVSFNLSQTFFSQAEMTKTMDVGTNSLNLYNFLSETAAITLYPVLLKSERDIVDHFFDSVDYNEVKELVGIVKLQTRKMRSRLVLIDSALSSLRMLLGFSVPGLCEQISRFLLNSDLKNLIDSTAPKARKRKASEISS